MLPYWLKTKSLWGQIMSIRASKALVENITVNKCYGFHQIKEAIAEYKANMTAGKIFFKPSLTE